MFSGQYRGAKVLLTGNTGFKGAWMAYWLGKLEADVAGFALPPEKGSLYDQAALADLHSHTHGDVCDLNSVSEICRRVKPDLVIHMAAQSLVRESYRDPVGTMMTNAMGTAHVCEALRGLDKPCALLIITSDKCYANNEWVYGYRENDPMGGSDPYSASKGVAELIAASWRKSFFPLDRLTRHQKVVSTARAGNVIGPGDWATDRIVPDSIRALADNQSIIVRNSNSVRPWQHVLEPLSGYLALGAKLLSADRGNFAEGWNFGPLPTSTRTVRELVETLIEAWGEGSWKNASESNPPPEASLLRLSIEKAEAQLAWSPVWEFKTTCRRTAHGYARLLSLGGDTGSVRELMSAEIDQYVRDARMTPAAWPNAEG